MPLGRLALDAIEAIAKARREARALEHVARPPLAVPHEVLPPLPVHAPKPRLALPAPPVRRALPKPAPALPEHVLKPKGGQWLPDVHFEGDILRGNRSPEEAARREWHNTMWEPDPVTPEHVAMRDWFMKAYPRYIRNEMGTASDPLRDLAARGLHWDPEMTPERWTETINSTLQEDPIGWHTVPAHANDPANLSVLDPTERENLLMAAPWLAKQPVTDMLYGMHRGGLDAGHFLDEMSGAIEGGGGLPNDLAVRPESLQRMSFPQAVERVGKINQWRAKQMENASLASLDNPALSVFKDYPEHGMRWAELKLPELPEDLGGHSILEEPGVYNSNQPGYIVKGPNGEELNVRRTPEEARQTVREIVGQPHLSAALRHEGDTMGHCVGGYCSDVMEGRSRIFSLRDAKGQPHVTIETEPGRAAPVDKLSAPLMEQQYPELYAARQAYAKQPYGPLRGGGGFADWVERNQPDLAVQHPDLFTRPDSITQIKGKQNRAPNEEYLPFVQDFVKSGQWGNVGDIENAQLVRLPGDRYIPREDFHNVISDSNLDDKYQSYDFNALQFPRDPSRMDPEDWAQFSHHFEGYAKGGPVTLAVPYEGPARGLSVAQALATQLPAGREGAYQAWRAQLPKPLQYEGDYDLRGAFLDNLKAGTNDHFSDKFKLPNHRTFSTGSIYNDPAHPAGRWLDNVFWASPENFRYQTGSKFAKYINEAEVPHGNYAVMPSDFDLRGPQGER